MTDILIIIIDTNYVVDIEMVPIKNKKKYNINLKIFVSRGLQTSPALLYL